MAAGDVYRITWGFHVSSLGLACSTAQAIQQQALTFDTDGILDAMEEMWDTGSGGADPLKSVYASLVTLVQLSVRKIDPLSPDIAIRTVDIDGSISDDNITPQSSPCTTMRTAKIGRSYRGRNYWPPAPETKTFDNGGLASDFQEALLEAVNEFSGVLDSTFECKVGVWSPKLSEFTEATFQQVGVFTRTQRRRAKRVQQYTSP